MSLFTRLRSSLCLGTLLFLLSGCAMQEQWREASSETVREQDLGGMPYHPVVYHLDLCVLAYQLYGQSLVWPFDPYYEDLSNWQWDRNRMKGNVHGWAAAQGGKQVKVHAGPDGYRGPGALGGFEDNPSHDPILYRYSQIHPWSNTITNADGTWTEYVTPKEITHQIKDVHICYRVTGEDEADVAIERLTPRRQESAPGARDVLFAFEGGTGDKGESGQPDSQSLMGFVLLRHFDNGGKYDVHIAFRGSRSGSALRAALQALSSGKANGNPDWITDMGFNRLMATNGGGHITTTGKVSRGFAHSMDSILPKVFRCLEKAAGLESGRRPERIYVTGHSLGGALAQHFVSAVLLGNRYGPDGAGKAMPAALRRWPWEDIKLITFGAPRAGDAEWARALTEKGLDSEVFSTTVDPYDRTALPVAHPSIVPRLMDKNRPAGYRVLLTQDPITTSKLTGGKHIGKSVYVDKPHLAKLFAAWSFGAHQPNKTRDHMLEQLSDSRIPPTAWRYREMTELNPLRDNGKRGRVEEYRKLKDAIERYYRDNGQWFDAVAFDRDFDLFLSLLDSQ